MERNLLSAIVFAIFDAGVVMAACSRQIVDATPGC